MAETIRLTAPRSRREMDGTKLEADETLEEADIFACRTRKGAGSLVESWSVDGPGDRHDGIVDER